MAYNIPQSVWAPALAISPFSQMLPELIKQWSIIKLIWAHQKFARTANSSKINEMPFTHVLKLQKVKLDLKLWLHQQRPAEVAKVLSPKGRLVPRIISALQRPFYLCHVNLNDAFNFFYPSAAFCVIFSDSGGADMAGHQYKCERN